MGGKPGFRKTLNCLSVFAVGLGGFAWYLRGWQPLPDVKCARLTGPAPDERPLLDTITAVELRRDTEALAAIRPRNSGTRGEAQARQWVASRFREMGLHHVRREAVLYPRWVGGAVRLALLSRPEEELDCLLLNGSAATPQEGLTASLIDVGGGQAEDYASRTREQTAGRFHLAWGGSLHRRDICANARRSGAVGVIIAHPDSRPEEVGGEKVSLVEAGTSTVFGRLPTLSVSHATGRRLRQEAKEGTPLRINASRKYTVGRTYNVIGELTGQTRDYVMLVAHHDAWYAGAADNAAGVAAILALARAWLHQVDRGTLPKRSLRFVSTGAEEDGLMGALSDVILRGLKVKARCRGVVSLDVVGAPGETLWATGWPPQLCGAAVAIGRGLGYETATGNPVRVYDGRAYGDHWPYTLMRIPGVLLGKFPYRYYHTPFDTPDRLDYEDARLQTAIGGTLAWRLANR